MDSVLTLIAPQDGLSDRLLRQVRGALDGLGADSLAASWLAPGRAADIPFSLLAPCQAEAAARQSLNGLAVDLVAQPLANRRKTILLADMDSTIVDGETLDDLAAGLGLGAEVAALTAQAVAGQADFAASLRQRVALLRGTEIARLSALCQDIRYIPGAATLVATMRAHGAFTVLASGGFAQFTAHVAQALGFQSHFSNHLTVESGRLTGALDEPLLDGLAKCKILQKIAAQRQQPLSLCLAVGDGANDREMIGAAGLGVAFHGKPALTAVAPARIDYTDLHALLFIQGYKVADFVLSQ
ncbi:MAG TPA: phosphoserine phosphatase SerB [Rhodospirillaceae bacterium]|nr:phosphoserine phosphatase SerB [Rhodospirillaceae bacterium]